MNRLAASLHATTAAASIYAELLKHPKWQEKRLRILQRAGFRCECCGADDRTLHAHHKLYLKGRRPWEYDDVLLECLCDDCHAAAHAEKAELDLLVACQPTARLPQLIDAVAHAAPSPEWNPRMRLVFDKLGAALSGGGATALTDAQNQLQDLIDEARDYRRGSGSVRYMARCECAELRLSLAHWEDQTFYENGHVSDCPLGQAMNELGK